MKLIKIAITALSVACLTIGLSGCENTQVSGSVSYGVGYGAGYGYPMYYGGGYPPRGNTVVVRPPRHERPRPSRPPRGHR